MTWNADRGTIHRFQGNQADGANPLGVTLIGDQAGTLYGTTLAGGGQRCTGGQIGCGTVFALTPKGGGYRERILHRFKIAEASAPYAGVIADASGALYGTTGFGPYPGCDCGVVYKLTPVGNHYAYETLHVFEGGSDGTSPQGALLASNGGAFYGTTGYGGPNTCGGGEFPGCGTVFKITPSASGYSESIVYRFRGGSDGIYPRGALISDSSGALYGTTSEGGAPCKCGTVFKLTPSGSGFTESILYSFQGGNDGSAPISGLLADGSGVLYGTTYYGGGVGCGGNGCGTVFKLSPNGSQYTESILYSFKGPHGDGANPWSSLIEDESSALYGTTSAGGGGCVSTGCGAVFKLTPSASGYIESILSDLSMVGHSQMPTGGLYADATGALYGSAYFGGRTNCEDGCGTVFKVGSGSSNARRARLRLHP